MWGIYQRKLLGHWIKPVESLYSWLETTVGVQDDTVTLSLSQGELLSRKIIQGGGASVTKNI